jgi:hypothetical protein
VIGEESSISAFLGFGLHYFAADNGKTPEALARVLYVVFYDGAFNHQWEI